jgi:hypothetical protein
MSDRSKYWNNWTGSRFFCSNCEPMKSTLRFQIAGLLALLHAVVGAGCASSPPTTASPTAEQALRLSAIKGCRFVMEATTDIDTRLMMACDVDLFVDSYGWLRDAQGTRLPGIMVPMSAERLQVEPNGRISWTSRDRGHWVLFGRLLVVERSVAEAAIGKESLAALQPLWKEQANINKSLTLERPTEIAVRPLTIPYRERG